MLQTWHGNELEPQRRDKRSNSAHKNIGHLWRIRVWAKLIKAHESITMMINMISDLKTNDAIPPVQVIPCVLHLNRGTRDSDQAIVLQVIERLKNELAQYL